MSITLFWDGLLEASDYLKGDEVMFGGLRPWGMHAGNILTLVAYPYLLFEQMEKMGKKPRFKYYITLNDWEPARLAFPKGKEFEHNVYPVDTSFEYTLDVEGCHKSIVDHVEGPTREKFKIIRKDFPGVDLAFVRNSELKENPLFMKMIGITIKDSKRIAEIIRDSTGRPVLTDEAQYAGAVCPSCKSSQGKTLFENGVVSYECSACGNASSGKLGSFDYWCYHIPLFAARVPSLKIAFAIRGLDHYETKRIHAGRDILNYYFPDTGFPRNLIAPMLIAGDGQKMSKTRGNALDMDTISIIKACRGNKSENIKVESV